MEEEEKKKNETENKGIHKFIKKLIFESNKELVNKF